MGEGTAWEKAAAAVGTTDSERVLARLARKAFLSLWSYPNVYTDEGRSRGIGDGKDTFIAGSSSIWLGNLETKVK